MFKKTVLSNGLRVLTKEIPYVKSVTIGFWIGLGSRNENKDNQGIAHFIEHLNFKGTEVYSAKDIAEIVDDFGGQMNAFTGKEYTCYYVKVLEEHAKVVFSLLRDMIISSKYAMEDILKERQVVLEEIAMSEDAPDELAYDVHFADVWGDNPLGFNILGTKETVVSFDSSAIKKYHANAYNADNIIVAVAGSLEHENIVAMSAEFFGGLETGKSALMVEKAHFVSGGRVINKDIEQTHICLSTVGKPYGAPDSYTFHIFNNIFGGSVSSRLFQEIREEKGLAYSVCSSQSSYKDCGLFSVYAATRPENVVEVISLIRKSIDNIKENGITDKEFMRAKEHIKSSFILGLENSSSYMSRIGKLEIMLGKYVPTEQVVQRISQVAKEDVVRLSQALFSKHEIHYTILGNVPEIDYLSSW